MNRIVTRKQIGRAIFFGKIIAALYIGTMAGLFGLPLPALWAQNEVIVFTRPDGGVSVVNPAPECLAQLQRPLGSPTVPGQCPVSGLTLAGALDWIRQKDVPANATHVTVRDRSELSPSRRFRDAWRIQAGVVHVDLPAARVIREREIARAIDKEIAASAVAGQTAWDARDNVTATAHETYRNALRALRGQLATDLAAIADLATLDTWTPVYPRSP